MSQARYRAAIIGTGGIARAHARGWSSRPEVQVVAAADIRQEALDRFLEEFPGLTAYTDVAQMLAQERPDIVSICTWPGSHAPLTVQAAEAGVRAILCEKPMATSLGEADAMIEAAQKNGVKLAIGHHHRFNPRNTEARRQIAQGAIGTPPSGPDGHRRGADQQRHPRDRPGALPPGRSGGGMGHRTGGTSNGPLRTGRADRRLLHGPDRFLRRGPDGR
ncbi:MAG: hypothetical protein KatS3mg115_2314 [Candidatus Poribacteria bacterium]|nr:MAG: hypothetical protein KatS3mg115_2314 [Candidatus Poribacteria bacterium]